MINVNFIAISNDMQIDIDYKKIIKLKKPFNIITATRTLY